MSESPRTAAKTAAVAIAVCLLATPCSAQALDLNPYGLALDPYHIFPPGGPAEVPTARHHRPGHPRRALHHQRHHHRRMPSHGA